MSILETGQRLVQDQFAALPEGKHGALLAVATPEDGARLAFVARAGEHWQFVAWLDAKPKAAPLYGVAIEALW